MKSNPDLFNSEIFTNEFNAIKFTIPKASSNLDSTLEFISLNQFIGLGFILILSISVYLFKRKYYEN